MTIRRTRPQRRAVGAAASLMTAAMLAVSGCVEVRLDRAADCDQVNRFVTAATPLERLVLAVMPPLPEGLQGVVGQVLPPDSGPRLDPEAKLAVPDPEHPRLVLVGTTSKSPSDLMRSFQEAVAGRGWKSSVAGETKTNNKLIGFSIRYEGEGTRGIGTILDCRDNPRRFIIQGP